MEIIVRSNREMLNIFIGYSTYILYKKGLPKREGRERDSRTYARCPPV